MATEVDSLETVELGDPATADYSIIWLHGLGADGHDFVSLVPQLNLPASPQIRFVFPHAPVRPVTVNGGYPMRAWFDIADLTFSEDIDEAGITDAISAVHQLIDQEIAHGIPSENIFLAGFSQGGFIALLSGLFCPKQLAGLISLSSFLWRPPQFDQQRQPINQKTPILIAHGSQDDIVPFKSGETSAQLLESYGYEVSFNHYPMGHAVCRDETTAISKWLQQHL